MTGHMIVRTADGGPSGTYVYLWCPGCEDLHCVSVGGTEGTQWTWDGDREHPTISPSILVCGAQWPKDEFPEYHRPNHASVAPGQDTVCHSFVRAGRWEFLPDSTHVLAGQTVDCVPIPDEVVPTGH